MGNKEQKWEQILKIIEGSMKPAQYELWISELELMKVDEELQAIFVSARDPFKGAYVMRQYGDNLDRAAEIIMGSGYKVYITYDKERQLEDDYLSIRDNEFTVVENRDDYKHRVRMLFLTNTDVDEEEVFNVMSRMHDTARRQKAMKTAESLLRK